MSTESKRSADTQRRLLEAAAEVFAEKGYHEATIAEICEKAGANIAAVNYHFGGKETLYVEAWRRAFQQSVEANPPDGGVGDDAPPEQRLEGRIRSLIRRSMTGQSLEFEIVHKELANPTGLLMEVFRESIQPIRQGLFLVVRELLGEKATEADARLCQMSVGAQCMHPMMRQRHRKMLAQGDNRMFCGGAEPDAEALADHVMRFSLAAIRAIRRQIECGEASEQE